MREELPDETPLGLSQYDHLPVEEAILLAWAEPAIPELAEECRAIVHAALPVLARALCRYELARRGRATPPCSCSDSGE